MMPLGITLWNISLLMKGTNMPMSAAIDAVSSTAKTVEDGRLLATYFSRSMALSGREGRAGKKSRASLLIFFMSSASTLRSSPFWSMQM